jgi:putative transcriptional regulator
MGTLDAHNALKCTHTSYIGGCGMPIKSKAPKDVISARRTALHQRACAGELMLPEAVKEMRIAIGMTQADFAYHFGLTRKQVIALESGNGNPTLKTLTKICRPFGFKVGFVFPGPPPD